MMNYFDILNVSIGAEPEVIKASYRTLAKKYHPDSYTGSKEEAEIKMAQINEAYQILSENRLRAEYITKLGLSKTNTKCTSTDGNEDRKYQNTQEKTNGEKKNTQYSDDSPVYDFEDDKLSKLFSRIIILIIVISIICCIIHFGSSIWRVFFEKLFEQIEELKYNFSL